MTVHNKTNREVNLGVGLDVHVNFITMASVASILFSSNPIISASGSRTESFDKTIESAGKVIESVLATVRSITKNDIKVTVTSQPSTNKVDYPTSYDQQTTIVSPLKYDIPDGTKAITLDVTITLKNG